MNYGGFRVLLLTILPAVFANIDYCKPGLCEKGRKHIACRNNEDFAYICEKPEIIKMTEKYRMQILKTHNSLRNEVAEGLKKFPQAARMATIVWDNELAKLAELNVKQCVVYRDKCRNTPRFLFAGQNVGSTVWGDSNFTVCHVINKQIQEWTNEYHYCSLDVIKSYKATNCTAFNTPYSRFTTMVQEKSTHIGCAILRSVSCDYTQQIMACNYAFDNILGAPVYNAGKTASQCTSGASDIFPSLCSVREKYSITINLF